MSQKMVKLNTNAFTYHEKRTTIGLGFQSLFYFLSVCFRSIKTKLFGSGTQLRQPRFFKPIATPIEPSPKIVEIKEIKKIIKRKSKIKKEKNKIIIRFPEIDIEPPQINWIKVMPFVKVSLKYVALVVICFIIMLGTLWFFSDRILAVLAKNHEIFQNEQVIKIIQRETIPYNAQIENLDDRVKELEIGKANFIYFQHMPRKHQVLNSKKTKFIVR
jgi:hypothetical protein